MAFKHLSSEERHYIEIELKKCHRPNSEHDNWISISQPMTWIKTTLDTG